MQAPANGPSSPTDRTPFLIPGDSTTNDASVPFPILELPLGLPLCHETFRTEDFDPDQFLLSRRHTALDDLRVELRTYLSGLRAELVGLINEDYEDFIGLGMGLRGTVERAMGKMKAPVEEAKEEIETAKQQLEEERIGLEGLLNERRKVIDGKKLVRLMLDCGEAVTKVEEMLSIKPPSLDPSLSPTHKPSHAMHRNRSMHDRHELIDDLHGIESGTKRMERVVSEFNQMLYLVSKGSDLAYVTGLKQRISHITHNLHRELASLLKSTLLAPKSDPRKKDCLMECLRAYESLGATHEAEEVIKNELVLPGLTKLIHRNCLNSGAMSPVLPESSETIKFPQSALPPSSSSSSTSAVTSFTPIPLPNDPELVPLPLMYNKILAFIARELSVALEVADRQLAGSKAPQQNPLLDSNDDNKDPTAGPRTNPTYNLLLNAVISPILQSITNTLSPSGLFASGNPSVFHRNYTTTALFLSQLEGLCASPRQVFTLRSHPDWLAFRNRWQLAVYAQIRTRETISRVEEGLQDGKAEASGFSDPGRPGYLLRATETIEGVLTTLWREDVFLADLTHRFWRLTLMTLSRYSTWLSTVTVGYISHASATASALAAPSNSPANSRSSTDYNRLAASSPTLRSSRPGTPVGAEEMTEEETLRQMTTVMADVAQLKVNILNLFKLSIGPRLPKVAVGAAGLSPEDIMIGMLEKIESIIPGLCSYTVTILVRRCSEKLRLIRSVGSSARAARTIPTEPSFFIPDILADLRTFVDRLGGLLAPELRSTLVSSVVEEIAARFLNILINVQRSEDSLRKLKKGRQGFSIFGNNVRAPNAKAEADDADEMRVKVQMRLDVERLRADAIELGARVEDCKSMIELRRTVDGGA